ncbi:hypothetical protein PIB30_029020 [Stylosanthes scabra]|uniref:Uncharacterized protein n=2 Tax=Stylosanthes scabra TaxID=79078 RepID=A0ABU6Y8F3_9FABA|nr:hypothetical protein [Stylosanthes scabra]
MYPPPYPTYTPNLYPPSSLPQSSDYGSIFQSFHSLAKYAQPKTPIPPLVHPTGFKPNESKPRPRPPWKPEFREFFPGDSSGIDKREKEEKASDRASNFMAQNDSTSEEESSTDFSEETFEEDHIADVSAIAMVNPAGKDSDEGHVTDDDDHRQPRQTAPSLPPPDSFSSKSGNFYFTFDDIDPDKYRQRLNDFVAWIDTRMTIPGVTLSQTGHFAKNCPKKKSKREVKMLQSLQDTISLQDDDDFEDILEEQLQKDADTQYVLHISDSDSCSDLTDDEDEHRLVHAVTTILSQKWITQEEMGHLGSIGLKQIDNTPRPHFNIKVKASKYDRPVKAVAFLDTGSCATIVKPHMLPSEAWIPFNKKFTTINQEVFTISLISKENIGLQLFPEVTTWIRVLGSDLLDKDVLFGYDAYYRTRGVSIWPDGLKYKKQFLPFSTPMSILEFNNAASEYEDIQQRLLKVCCDSHDKFTHPYLLWKNQEFFIKLLIIPIIPSLSS